MTVVALAALATALTPGIVPARLAGGAAAQDAPAASQEGGAERQTAPDRDELTRTLLTRIRSLDAQIERARLRSRRETAYYDSVAAARVRQNTDTVRVGPLTIVAEPDLRAEATREFGRVWDEMSPMIGGAVDFEGATFLYDPQSRLQDLRLAGRVYRIHGRNWQTLAYDPDAVRYAIRSQIGREISMDFTRTLQRWAGGSGPVPANDDWLSGFYRRVALSEAESAGRCLDGDLEACWASHGLSLEADPTDSWYTRDWLRTSAPRRDQSLAASRAIVRLLQCGGSESCPSVYDEPRDWLLLIPFDARLRADLLGFAVSRGGDGAVGRFLAEAPVDRPSSDGSSVRMNLSYEEFARGVRRGIVAASGMEADELMAAWRDRIVAARPDSRSGEKKTRFATFLWILVFAAFATRSTRWRLG